MDKLFISINPIIDHIAVISLLIDLIGLIFLFLIYLGDLKNWNFVRHIKTEWKWSLILIVICTVIFYSSDVLKNVGIGYLFLTWFLCYFSLEFFLACVVFLFNGIIKTPYYTLSGLYIRSLLMLIIILSLQI